MSDIITLGIDSLVVDLDKMFPELPLGNIYIALTGGVESTILLYLMLEKYSANRLIACTYRFGDRRSWEFANAKRIADMFGVRHIEAGYLVNSAIMAEDLPTAREYFNRENGVFNQVKRNDPSFVAGFTGKNTTSLDPEIITPEEQSKYLIWYNIHRPFLKMDKHNTTDLYYKLGVGNLLRFTQSCQRFGDHHCGECYACWERIYAFELLGKKDPAIYKQDYDLLAKQVKLYFLKRWPRHVKER